MDGFILKIASRAKKRDEARQEGPSYGDVEADAAGELAEILELEGESADRFKAALADYVDACVERATSEVKNEVKKPSRETDE